jgi:hypothetical protein
MKCGIWWSSFTELEIRIICPWIKRDVSVVDLGETSAGIYLNLNGRRGLNIMAGHCER